MQRFANGIAFSCEILDDRPGQMILNISGDKTKIFSNESGGHRWQRKSPTGKGEMHSSTITVAIMDEKTDEYTLKESDVKITCFIGQGPGGQHRQKNRTAVRAVHIPTGIVACCENERSQYQNKLSALSVLSGRVQEHFKKLNQQDAAKNRKEQIGSGQRSDKIRTVQEQNGMVINHLLGKKVPIQEYLKGKIEKLVGIKV